MRDADLIPAHITQHDAVAEAQSAAEVRNELRRKMERMAKYTAWVHPFAIKLRMIQLEMGSEAALEKGRRMGRVQDPLPVPDPLPKCMQGQSASTIQAMLRNGWRPEE